MVSRLEEETMIQALNECFVSELPEPLDKNDGRIWCRGIAKVYKCDMSVNYSVVINDGYGNPKVVHDLGHVSTIARIGEVYPTIFMSSEYMPVIKSKKDYLRYLVGKGDNSDYVNMLLSSTKEDGTPKSDEEKDSDKATIKAMAIRHAIDDMMEDIMHTEVISYDDLLKEEENGQEKDK